jgi:hypothetical protein
MLHNYLTNTDKFKKNSCGYFIFFNEKIRGSNVVKEGLTDLSHKQGISHYFHHIIISENSNRFPDIVLEGIEIIRKN